MSEALAYLCVAAICAAIGAGIYVGGKAIFGVKFSYDEDSVLDHVPVKRLPGTEPQPDWRTAALVEAHRKYGRQFKAGPDGMGEVLKLQPDDVQTSKEIAPFPLNGEQFAASMKLRAVR